MSSLLGKSIFTFTLDLKSHVRVPYEIKEHLCENFPLAGKTLVTREGN